MAWRYGGYPRYVPVAERRAKARRKMEALRKQGQVVEPVEIQGRSIARSFWGKAWCEHLESFSDYSNRLPRGRTYVRNGSVCHLALRPGRIDARVSGSELYSVEIHVTKLKRDAWQVIRNRCAGRVGSMLELLQGRLSDEVMGVVTDREAGLFPRPRQIRLGCSCPDWATMCKHVAAVLYGVGSRLDEQPELLFTLRGVEAGELISAELALPEADGGAATIADDQLSDIFGIDVATGDAPAPAPAPSPPIGAKPRPVSRRSNGAAAKGTARRRGTTRRTASTSRSGAPATEPLPRLRPTGRSVARLRRQLRLTVPAFAQALGVSPPTVYRWEATLGRLKLQARSLNALATLKRDHSRR